MTIKWSWVRFGTRKSNSYKGHSWENWWKLSKGCRLSSRILSVLISFFFFLMILLWFSNLSPMAIPPWMHLISSHLRGYFCFQEIHTEIYRSQEAWFCILVAFFRKTVCACVYRETEQMIKQMGQIYKFKKLKKLQVR